MNLHIVCIGGANLDRKIQSLAPLQLGTSNPARSNTSFGGVARNIAENLTRLGTQVSLLTLVGADEDGTTVLRHCRECGMDVSAVVRMSQEHTGSYTAVLNATGELGVAMADMAIYEAFTPELLTVQYNLLKPHSAVVVDTNLPRATLAAAIRNCKESHSSLFLVPVSAPKMTSVPGDLEGVTALIGNQEEIYALAALSEESPHANSAMVDPTLEEVCKGIAQRGCENIIATGGASEVYYYTRQGESGFVAVPPSASVLDVTGAGDAFASGVILALNRYHSTLPEAIRLGIMVSGATLLTTETVSTKLDLQLVSEWREQSKTEGDSTS